MRQMTISPSGMEGIEIIRCPGGDGDICHTIHDFVRHGQASEAPSQNTGWSREMWERVQSHRDAHYPRVKRHIGQLREEIEGKTVVLVAPGPSLRKTFAQDWEDRPDVVLVSINYAVRAIKCHFAFVIDRNVEPGWFEHDGNLVEWVPDYSRLITSPFSHPMLLDYWTDDDRRYYLHMPYSEFTEDPRSQWLIDHNAACFSLIQTPVTALHWAAKMGAKKIVLVGHDFSYDLEGNYYWDMPAHEHVIRRGEPEPKVYRSITGEQCLSTEMLLYQKEIMWTCCYWIERSARIPVLNATEGGLLDWRPESIRIALEVDHCPVVEEDYGVITNAWPHTFSLAIPPRLDKGFFERKVQSEVEGSGVPAEVAGVGGEG